LHGHNIISIPIVPFVSCYCFYLGEKIERIAAKYENEKINDHKMINKQQHNNNNYNEIMNELEIEMKSND
jgi:hypothetical protein